MNQWLYFGCYGQPGHYVFTESMRDYRPPHGSRERELARFDGMLPPQDSAEPYIATVSRLEGWGLSALAFWDYSVDRRIGCNSVIFAPSLTIEPAELLAEAQSRFPKVFGRLPQPVRLRGPEQSPSALEEERLIRLGEAINTAICEREPKTTLEIYGIVLDVVDATIAAGSD